MLLVDDDLMRRYALAQILRLDGFEVHSESGHASWLALFKSCLSEPALIVSFVAALDPDLLLLAVDGRAALPTIGALRHHPLTDHVPVIALGDRTRARELETALALGAARSLLRPISAEVLRTEVGIVLAAQRPRPARTGDEVPDLDVN